MLTRRVLFTTALGAASVPLFAAAGHADANDQAAIFIGKLGKDLIDIVNGPRYVEGQADWTGPDRRP